MFRGVAVNAKASSTVLSRRRPGALVTQTAITRVIVASTASRSYFTSLIMMPSTAPV